MNNEEFLRVERLSKAFGPSQIFKDISFCVNKGEFVSLLGPSGCGKTTLLRCIMGLTEPDTGTVTLEGEDITHTRIDKRGISIVFQDYALFPHMTLYNNVAYPLRIKKADKAEIKQKVSYALNALDIEHAAHKYPSQLSGGMQQRAAIARSLVIGSRLMLLDEPFSALDAMVKVDLSDELKELQRRFNITMVMVTHDQIDAVSLSNRILLMNDGTLVADSTPAALYHKGDDAFIQKFFVEQIDKRAGHLLDLGIQL